MKAVFAVRPTTKRSIYCASLLRSGCYAARARRWPDRQAHLDPVHSGYHGLFG